MRKLRPPTKGLIKGHKRDLELESLLSVVEKKEPCNLILVCISWYNMQVWPETPFNTQVEQTAWDLAAFQVQWNGGKRAEPKRLPRRVSWQ